MRFILAPLLMFISVAPALSQTDKLNFRTLALNNTKLPDLWVAAAGKAVPLSFSNAQPSAPLKADRTSPLKVFKTPFDDKGKPTDTTPLLVELPAESSSVLLLGWMEEAPAFLAVSDPFATAKPDDWLVINHTTKSLTLQIGADTPSVPIEPNSQLTVRCAAPVGEGAATTVASKQDDGTMKTVYSSYLPVYGDKRGLLLVVQKGERISVSYIADPVTGKAAAKKR